MDAFPTADIDFAAIGGRLKAYRLEADLRAETVACQLGISRAAVYKLEKGEIVKIDTLVRLAAILRTSLASLLGVESEYYASAIGYMERMRQLEQGALRIYAHFEPVSYLLTSSGYDKLLRTMLLESSGAPNVAQIDTLMQLLAERKAAFGQSRTPIVSLVSLRNLERMMHFGLIGGLHLDDAVRAQRIDAARHEILRIADLIEEEPMGLQIGLLDENIPNSTFEVVEHAEGAHVGVSPFRLGEFPNIANGIATVSSSPEAARLYTSLVQSLWKRALKGGRAARHIREMVYRAVTALKSD